MISNSQHLFQTKNKRHYVTLNDFLSLNQRINIHRESIFSQQKNNCIHKNLIFINIRLPLMKRNIIIALFSLLIVSFSTPEQEYPVPPVGKNHLFYIQHSNNHNTFVYDANFTATKKLSETEPVKVYRITYTKGGIKEELSPMQRKLAYGIDCKKTAPNTFDCTLAAYPSKKLVLKLHQDGSPYVTVNVNDKNIVLKKMFLLVNKTGTNVTYIDFYGKDNATGKEIKERFIIDK